MKKHFFIILKAMLSVFFVALVACPEDISLSISLDESPLIYGNKTASSTTTLTTSSTRLKTPDFSTMSCDAVAGYKDIFYKPIDRSNDHGLAAEGPVPTDNQLAWQQMEFYGFIHFGINTFIIDKSEKVSREWGEGKDSEESKFDPTGTVDTDQWMCEMKRAGMRGVVLTAKHHDGFALWPSKYKPGKRKNVANDQVSAGYSVASSPWKKGKGDVVKLFVESAKKYGMKIGFYLSPWDRRHPDYGLTNIDGTKPYVTYSKPYVTYYRKQLEELLDYGNKANVDVFEIWFDGARGSDGYHGGNEKITRTISSLDYYDYPSTFKIVTNLAPKAVMFQKDIRWIGNEKGYVPVKMANIKQPNSLKDGENWSVISNDMELTGGLIEKKSSNDRWAPGECDTTISNPKKWFSNSSNQLKSKDHLVASYYECVGKNANLILNVAPDKTGSFPSAAVTRLKEMGKALYDDFKTELLQGKKVTASNVRKMKDNNTKDDVRFKAGNANDGDANTYWTTDDLVQYPSLIFDLGDDATEKFDTIVIQEYISLGQRVSDFTIEIGDENAKGKVDKWTDINVDVDKQYGDSGNKQAAETKTIGYKRILKVPEQTLKDKKLKITINKTRKNSIPLISNVELYNSPDRS